MSQHAVKDLLDFFGTIGCFYLIIELCLIFKGKNLQQIFGSLKLG